MPVLTEHAGAVDQRLGRPGGGLGRERCVETGGECALRGGGGVVHRRPQDAPDGDKAQAEGHPPAGACLSGRTVDGA